MDKQKRIYLCTWNVYLKYSLNQYFLKELDDKKIELINELTTYFNRKLDYIIDIQTCKWDLMYVLFILYYIYIFLIVIIIIIIIIINIYIARCCWNIIFIGCNGPDINSKEYCQIIKKSQHFYHLITRNGLNKFKRTFR